MVDVLPILILLFFSIAIVLLRSRNAQKSRRTWQSVHKQKPTQCPTDSSSFSDRFASAGLKTICVFIIFYCITTFWTYFLLPDAKLAVSTWVTGNSELFLFLGIFIVIFVLFFVLSEVLALRKQLEK